MFTEDQRMIADTIRAFSQEKLFPGAEAREAAAAIEPEIIQEMGSLGLFGMTIPPEWDGAGTDTVSYALALIEVAAGDGAISTVMSVHNSPVCEILRRFGTDEQKDEFLRPLARGDALGSFGLTESQAGSDASALKTRAVRDGDEYVLNGSKQFISNGKIGTYCVMFAVTDSDAGKKGISCFVVPTDTPGYSVVSVESKLGQRASDTCSLAFEDVRIPGSNRIGDEGQGYSIALSSLESGRIGIAAQSVGMARSAFEIARDYAFERETFGKLIFEHQAVSFRLAEMETELEAAQQLVLNAARLKDAGESCLREACMAKLFASEAAERICSGAIQTLGGYGYLSDFPLERIYRDVRVCQIYEGTSDIQKLIIAREMRK